ncbi:FecR family protein [Flammeovirga sp. OC4]|uniref:FecR family protein n=1 Tax=Flammeovirga sp. OC4 TaxID=1382345 RepID=UPI0005C6D7F6|nr:FecR domain-containing protein [Flammeovirga sp. OC4]
MDKEINIDWTLIAESLGGDQMAVVKAKQLAETDETFKSVLSEVTEIWIQSTTIGQEKKRILNASRLDAKVNEIWDKILEVESEETKIATTLENQSNEVSEEVLDIWSTASSLGKKQRKDVSSEDMDAAMAKMLLRMNVSAEEKKEAPTFKVEKNLAAKKNNTSTWSFPNSMAAAVAILLTLGLSMFYYLDSDKVQMLQKETGNTTALVKLPDGTKVWLNKESSIRYPESFGDNDRVVSLEGDAFFEVKRDEEHAFNIITSEATTTVLGTSFHLTQNQVEVVTGKVRFESKESGEYVVLVKNETGAIADGTVSKTVYEQELNAASLMQTELSFKGADLSDAIKEIGKAYNTSIVIENKQLEKRKFTGTFRNKTLETVIEQVSEVVGCDTEKLEDGTVVLK